VGWWSLFVCVIGEITKERGLGREGGGTGAGISFGFLGFVC
jgi:hypothetical protein